MTKKCCKKINKICIQTSFLRILNVFDERKFFVSESKKNKNSKFNPPVEISVNYSVCNPDSCEEQVNVYGTYEIQPTNDSGHDFPKIAQGLPKEENRKVIDKD